MLYSQIRKKNCCVVLTLKLVKNSCKCYDEYQALRKSNMSCWQALCQTNVGHHPITVVFFCLVNFWVTLRRSQLYTVYKSALGMLAMLIQKICGHQFLIHSSLNCQAAGKDYDLGNYLVSYNIVTEWEKNAFSVQNPYNYCILCNKCKLMVTKTWYFAYRGEILIERYWVVFYTVLIS